jgi:hypothetical protein
MTYAHSEIPVLVECFKTSVNPSNVVRSCLLAFISCATHAVTCPDQHYDVQDSLKQAENTLKEHSRKPGYVLRTLEVCTLDPERLGVSSIH